MDTVIKILAWEAAIVIAAMMCFLVPAAIWLGKSFMDDLKDEMKKRQK